MTMRRASLLLFCTLLLASPAWAFENNSDVLALQTAAGATGDGLPLDVSKYSTVAVQVTISNTATITWEGSTHTSYTSISCTNKASAASATTATATGLYQCDVAGLATFRARISAWTSGTVDVVARASTATASSSSTISGGAGDASAANQTTMIGHVDGLEDGIGASADAAATAGAVGSLSAKLRLMTTQLGAMQTSLSSISTGTQLIDNIVSGTGANISQINGVAPLMGNGVSGTGAQRVTIASDSTGTIQVNNAAVRGTVGNMATGVTTNTTSAAVALPVGSKTIYGSVDGTGSVTQTQEIFGGLTSGVTSTTGEKLCTITLSGTTHAHNTCQPITANFLFYIVVTTVTTGTSATGVVTAMY